MQADAAGYTARTQTALRQALGPGRGFCLDLACGTGVHSGTIRELGWSPLGTDISAGQLRHAAARMPVVHGDAAHLPIRSGRLPAVVSLLCHTDVEEYAAVVNEAARVLVHSGVFVHVGVHPCFIGAFADRSDPERVVISRGYWRRARTFDGWSRRGIRARVGATHLPLSELLRLFPAAGLAIEDVVEVGEIPDVLAVRARSVRGGNASPEPGPNPENGDRG